jgi:1,4-dihydroxy-2-naphthoyl-CoA hydrolase
MPFHTEITVAFNDVDAAGIVYFGNVFDYCHRVFERLLETINIPLPQILKDAGWAMPLVHAEADYLKPILHGERLQVQVDLTKIGGSSLHFHYEIYGPGGELRARVTLVHATVETPGFQPQPVEQSFVAALRQLGLGPRD